MRGEGSMTDDVRDVLSGERKWAVQQGDLLDWLGTLPADSVDLVFGSPPYEKARTYGIGFNLSGQAWVDWMVKVFQASLRVCRGLVAFVLQGQTKNYRWSATPALLMADLHRAGIQLRNPPVFHRVGIPGSGGPDWLRGDYEWIVCATRGGKLPWSDNTASGHPPKWMPGGAMSHRVSNGSRVAVGGAMNKRHRDGTGARCGNPGGRRATRGHANGDTVNSDSYDPPVLANPGNTIQQTYTAAEVAAMLAEASDVQRFKVGGGLMGHSLAHENEAPFPLGLAEVFVRSFCPPDGVVLDPFSGSGTTGHASVLWRRRFVGVDIRESQVELTRRRLEGVTPMLLDV